MQKYMSYLAAGAFALAVVALVLVLVIPGVGTGTITGRITDDKTTLGIEGASVTTDPTTTTVTTDADGNYTIGKVPIGVYTVTASKSGYTDKSQANVSIAGSVTRTISLALPPTGTGTISGTVTNTAGTAIEGAKVTVHGTSLSGTTGADGKYTIADVSPGGYYIDVTSPSGYLDGGTRDAARISAGQTATADITLSARPSDSATYSGAATCQLCHAGGLFNSWQGSTHNKMIQFDTTTTFIATGWPAVGAWTDTGVDAKDHTGTLGDVEVGQPTSGNYAIRINGNVYDVFGTMGGNKANMWKQRYLTRDSDVASSLTATVATSGHYDVLILPVQWNIATGEWAGYHTSNWYEASRSWSKNCGGCHTTGTSVTVNASGAVTAWDYKDLNVSCESCHGPGSEHVAAGGGKAKAIINPNYVTATTETLICGSCHNRGKSALGSAGAPNALGYPWKADATTAGNGNFVAGIDSLVDFFTENPTLWADAVEHAKSHHQQYNDFVKSKHYDNPYDRMTCSSCHSPHSAKVGPYHMESGDYTYTSPTYKDNTLCLACHASHGDFATITKDQIATAFAGANGTVTKAGVELSPSGAEVTAAQTAIANAVVGHMNTRASMGMFVDYDPTNDALPVGRCTTCHMPKTGKSGVWTTGTNYMGQSGMVQGDISSHIFEVVTPQTSQKMAGSVSSDSSVIPNSCAICHPRYIYSGD